MSVSGRRCRHQLLSDGQLPVKEDVAASRDSSVLPLPEDDLPAWLAAVIEEAGWTKGKLTCPKCLCHVGGFDFISGSDVTIHIVRSKVDLKKNVPVVSAVVPAGS